MRGVLIAILVLGCSKPPAEPSGSVASPSAGTTSDTGPIDAAPPVGAPDDHAASARAMRDSTNYVQPGELAYSRSRKIVIYPACHGGEGPGESCQLVGLDSAGKSVNLATVVQWSTQNSNDAKGRIEAIAAITAALDELDTIRLGSHPWNRSPLDIPGFATLTWDPKGEFVATRDGKTTRTKVQWGEQGGPAAIYAADVPLAVALLRVNPTSGGREGYVVFVTLAVITRP
jgi:hypothetical protein